ncbi:MAG TPA: thymidine phosphorylase [Patescibacteria group bacterium]|nr:thymidine phosphorylase [Patescibacteria group bacterium]
MVDEKTLALEAIRKKLVGKNLTYKEVFAVMDEIAHNKLGDVLTTYFAASGYAKGFSDEELYFLTKAMVETGEKLQWDRDIIADKHSIGGVPGTRTTMIVVPIVAAAGFLIPKSSSRAITTPDGTADDMEILSHVEFTREEIKSIVKKTNGCIVWGGSFHIAPADDVLIHVESPLRFESFDKIIVSIMAKKIAFGSNHVVIDIPFGKTVKVHRRTDAEILRDKFLYIAGKFNIKLRAHLHQTDEPAGRGIGPVLETREALRVLEQTPDRPIDLERRALDLAGDLLDLCLEDSPEALQKKVKENFSSGYEWAKDLLTHTMAHKKMQEIITAQKGDASITTEDLTKKLGKHVHRVVATRNDKVHEINSQNITTIAKILGAPLQKGSGIYLNKKLEEHVEKGQTLFTMYSESAYNLKEAMHSLDNFPILK